MRLEEITSPPAATDWDGGQVSFEVGLLPEAVQGEGSSRGLRPRKRFDLRGLRPHRIPTSLDPQG